mmetsp:Transcript_20599/g.55552  ORF Transcript_20599/g.55552 Transcript_20599/m.55552 type:complete len:325 (+) Transcript_20599:829-1803(+)
MLERPHSARELDDDLQGHGRRGEEVVEKDLAFDVACLVEPGPDQGDVAAVKGKAVEAVGAHQLQEEAHDREEDVRHLGRHPRARRGRHGHLGVLVEGSRGGAAQRRGVGDVLAVAGENVVGFVLVQHVLQSLDNGVPLRVRVAAHDAEEAVDVARVVVVMQRQLVEVCDVAPEMQEAELAELAESRGGCVGILADHRSPPLGVARDATVVHIHDVVGEDKMVIKGPELPAGEPGEGGIDQARHLAHGVEADHAVVSTAQAGEVVDGLDEGLAVQVEAIGQPVDRGARGELIDRGLASARRPRLRARLSGKVNEAGARHRTGFVP